jgi:hypothetical protein
MQMYHDNPAAVHWPAVCKSCMGHRVGPVAPLILDEFSLLNDCREEEAKVAYDTLVKRHEADNDALG